MTVRPRAARERLVAVLVVLALGGAIVLASTQVFATVLPPAEKAVPVTGQQVAPTLAPLGIVLLALAAALTIAGRVAPHVLGGVLQQLGAVVVLHAHPSVLDPHAGTRG
ncbi:MAG: Trp biosynthesis-associated membrane protein, partial [Amnibacterium sp.]